MRGFVGDSWFVVDLFEWSQFVSSYPQVKRMRGKEPLLFGVNCIAVKACAMKTGTDPRGPTGLILLIFIRFRRSQVSRSQV